MEPPQTAFRDAMGSAHSSSLLWEAQVQEEQLQRGSAPGDRSRIQSIPDPDTPPPASEGGSTSNVSMVDNSLIQHDSDDMIEEEREEEMETGAPASPTAPMPAEELPMQQGSEARDSLQDDWLSQMSEQSTDQNLPHNSDLDEEELLGPVTNISVPGGHLDDSITLVVPPEEDNL